MTRPRSDPTNDLVNALLAEDLAPPPRWTQAHLSDARAATLRGARTRWAARRRAALAIGGWRFGLWRTRNRFLIGSARFEERR